jgi:hypothetical protein
VNDEKDENGMKKWREREGDKGKQKKERGCEKIKRK